MTENQEMRVRGTQKWIELRDIIKAKSFSHGETKVLASGRVSNFYFDMKRTMSQPKALNLIAELILPILYSGKCDVIGGLEMGAVPILNVVSAASYNNTLGPEIPLFWIRKKPKEHGERKLIEGANPDELKGKTAVMVDDVTTTGMSVLKAIEEARLNGVIISRVVTLVDRLEGAESNLREKDVELIPIFTADDFKN